MAKFKEIRKLDAYDLRNICVRNGLYTCGTNEEYSAILNYADSRKNVTTAAIVKIAEDILAHSDVAIDYTLSEMCFIIAEECHTFFEEVTQ